MGDLALIGEDNELRLKPQEDGAILPIERHVGAWDSSTHMDIRRLCQAIASSPHRRSRTNMNARSGAPQVFPSRTREEFPIPAKQVKTMKEEV